MQLDKLPYSSASHERVPGTAASSGTACPQQQGCQLADLSENKQTDRREWFHQETCMLGTTSPTCTAKHSWASCPMT
jgi:hypothetical protein